MASAPINVGDEAQVAGGSSGKRRAYPSRRDDLWAVCEKAKKDGRN